MEGILHDRMPSNHYNICHFSPSLMPFDCHVIAYLLIEQCPGELNRPGAKNAFHQKHTNALEMEKDNPNIIYHWFVDHYRQFLMD